MREEPVREALYVMVVLVFMLLVAGCPWGEDDDATDDDVGDDDSAGGFFEPAWAYYETELRLEATGGTQGGAATVRALAMFHDEAGGRLCTEEIVFAADYAYGALAGDGHFAFTDEVITVTEVRGVSGDCPSNVGVGPDALVAAWDEILFPLAFVSCDAVAANAELAAMELVPEPEIIFGDECWTFEDFCERIGPAASHIFDTGEHEAIWLRPCEPGALDDADEGIELSYLIPADTSLADAWAFYGFSALERGSQSGAAAGLDGAYQVLPVWSVVTPSN